MSHFVYLPGKQMKDVEAHQHGYKHTWPIPQQPLLKQNLIHFNIMELKLEKRKNGKQNKISSNLPNRNLQLQS